MCGAVVVLMMITAKWPRSPIHIQCSRCKKLKPHTTIKPDLYLGLPSNRPLLKPLFILMASMKSHENKTRYV